VDAQMDFMMLELITAKHAMLNVLPVLVLQLIVLFVQLLMSQLLQIVFVKMDITILMEILYVHNVKQNVLNVQELLDVQTV
jgi:hypothetical protein